MLNIDVTIKDQSKFRRKKGPMINSPTFPPQTDNSINAANTHVPCRELIEMPSFQEKHNHFPAGMEIWLHFQEDICLNPKCFLGTVRYLLKPYCSVL